MTVYNYFPDCVTESELINYASKHDDLYVRKLADVVETARLAVNYEGYHDHTVDEYIKVLLEQIRQLEWQLEEAENDKEKAEVDREEFSNRVAALRYDLDHNFQYSQIEALKAEAFDLQTQLFYERNKVRNLERDLDKLENRYKDLEGRYNTWTIIATK